MKKKHDWASFDETWGIGDAPHNKTSPPVQESKPQKKDIITRTREKLLNYWIERQNQKNQEKS